MGAIQPGIPSITCQALLDHPKFLGENFGIETAVILMLITFIIGFSIILTVIFRFSEMGSDPWQQKLGGMGWGRPSRLAANIAAVFFGLAWGALF